MKSEYKYRFFLRCAEATRTGWACLMVAAMLLYVPGIQTVFSVSVLAPVLAVVLAGPSLGTVLHNSWGALTVAIPALTSTIAVLHVIRPPISQFAAIACTGISSVIIAYFSETHILGRKVALAQVSIVYVTAHYTPGMNVVTFPLKMLATDALGIVMAIVATLVPIPRLAVWEVRESARHAARGSSELFNSLVKIVSAPDSSAFGSMHLHSKLLAKAAMETIADLKKKQADIWWELGGACGVRHANKRFTKGLDCLNLHLVGMEMALESGYILYTPAVLRGILQETFIKVVDQCNSLLNFAVEVRPRLSSTSSVNGKRQKAVEEGKEMLNLLDMSYRAAREQAYYTRCSRNSSENEFDLESWQDAYDRAVTHPPSFDLSLVKRKFRGMVSMLFFVFNLRLYLIEAINLASTGPSSANKMHQLAMIGPSITNLEQRMQSDNSNNTKRGSDKTDSPMSTQSVPKSGPVFLHPDDPSLLTASRRFSSGRFSNSGTLNSGPIVSRQSSHHQATVHSEVSLNPQDAAVVTEIADEETRESNGTGLPSGNGSKSPSEHRQCGHHRNGDDHNGDAKVNNAPEGDGAAGRPWEVLRKLGLKPSKTQTKRSLKTALSMVLATTFGFLVLKGKTQAFWAPVTVGFIIGNFQGGSWRISNLRLQGTVLGSIYGFLALNASNNHKWAILLLLTPWVIFSSYIRYSPDYGYSGLVSAFTAAVLMLGRYQNDIKSFAMDRITENFVGIMCFVFVETVIFPERAVVLVRRELVSSLVSLRDCVGAIVSVYTEEALQECPDCRSLAVIQIKQLEHRLRASFANQSVLSKEAALEPDLWFVPFPAEVYPKLIAIQGRMLDLLYFMVCSLHATTEECVSEQMETLLKPLRTSLTALQEEVIASLDFLQEILQVKPVHEGGIVPRLKRWLACCPGLTTATESRTSRGDVEQQTQPQSTSPYPHHPLLVLGRRDRSVDGIPTSLKAIMDSFERSFEEVFESLIAKTKEEGAIYMLSNTVMMSFGSLTFSLHALLRETVHLEKAVHELLQAESRWSVVDLWENYAKGIYHNPPPLGARQ
ncbi:unnamed protein product [Calypogeia fissa]